MTDKTRIKKSYDHSKKRGRMVDPEVVSSLARRDLHSESSNESEDGVPSDSLDDEFARLLEDPNGGRKPR